MRCYDAGMRPYFQRDGITIYHGRCEEVLPSLSGVDLVFTSPPYNLGTTSGGGFADVRKYPGMKMGKWGGGSLAHGYGAHDDAMPHEQYVAWQGDVLRLCWNVLSDRGAIFYNHKPRVLDGRLVAPLDYVPGDLRPYVRQEVIWKRSGGINFSPAFYLPMHERIVVIAKRGFRLTSKGASGVGDVWQVHQESNSPHPAPFPLKLPTTAIETTAPALVLDPFCGSGTTLRAAMDAGVSAIGIEREERWCEYTVKRLQQAVLPLMVAD